MCIEAMSQSRANFQFDLFEVAFNGLSVAVEGNRICSSMTGFAFLSWGCHWRQWGSHSAPLDQKISLYQTCAGHEPLLFTVFFSIQGGQQLPKAAAATHGAEGEIYVSILGNLVELFPSLLRDGWHNRRKQELTEAAKSMHRGTGAQGQGEGEKGCGPVLAVTEPPDQGYLPISAWCSEVVIDLPLRVAPCVLSLGMLKAISR